MSNRTSLHDLDYSVLQQCMHCGLCLPTCPTYDESGRERSSPRGRIALMRAVADDRLPVSETFADEMAYCVGCLACQTACPAGVDYARLIEEARAEVQRSQPDRGSKRFYRWFVLRFLFQRPWLMRLIGRLLAIYQKPFVNSVLRRMGVLRLAPRRLRELEPKAPQFDPPFTFARLRSLQPPVAGKPSYRVGLPIGCVQDLAYARINVATSVVLQHNGCEVITPRSQACCGSLHAHNGDPQTAAALAKRNLEAFPVNKLDAIVSNAGGCGSHMKRYAEMFGQDDSSRPAAEQWDSKLHDIHEWLIKIGLRPPTQSLPGLRVAYDDSCHLLHGQRVREQPRQVLEAIPGVRLVPLPESDWCCGSAGIYSIVRPDSAERLLSRKLDNLEAVAPDVVATANPGCLLQLLQGVTSRPKLQRIRVVHPIELLAESYGRCES